MDNISGVRIFLVAGNTARFSPEHTTGKIKVKAKIKIANAEIFFVINSQEKYFV
jgi:hypothetical protein